MESYRDDGKVRQRTLLSLGRVEDGKLDDLAAAVAKHTDLMTAAEVAKSISVESTFVLGPLLIVNALFERLGLDDILKKIQSDHKQLSFSLRDVIFGLVVSRFIRPSSKLAVYEQLLESFYPELAPREIDLHHLYRALDVLSESKDEIETSLFFHERDLFSRQVDVVLYDLTTLRFESTKETESLRRFGFSKEHRSDCTQVVLGLLVDTDGMPLGFEVYPGNTVEGKTLTSIVDKMRDKFCVRRFIFVADRGLLSKKNLKTIQDASAEFIVGMRIGGLAKKRPDLYDRTRFSKVADGLEAFETTFDDHRGIVTWSRDRAERDAKVRGDILKKIRAKLAKKKVTAKSFVSNSNYTYFLKGLDKGEAPSIDENKIEAAALKDGFFAIVTNIKDKPAAELFAQYKQLWKIEDAFGEFKGTLRARPVFHWTDKRIIGHLTMCFITLLCEAHVARALRASRDRYTGRAVAKRLVEERQLSAVVAMRELAEVRAVPVTIRNETLWLRTDINGHVAILFQRLGVRIPPKLLKRERRPDVVAQGPTAPASN